MHRETIPITFLRQYEIKTPTTFKNNSYDFIYMISGRVQIMFNHMENSYSSGGICLIRANQEYTILPGSPNIVIHLGISPLFLYQYLGLYGSYVCDSALEPINQYSAIKQLILQIAAAYLENSADHYLTIYSLLFLLLKEINIENSTRPSLEHSIPDKYQQRIQSITEYIDQHYHESLSLTLLADELFLTPQYLSRFFKDAMHISFKKYVTDVRLYHASRDLCYTNDSISDIAAQNGFNSTNTFHKNFIRKYQVSPAKYRKQEKQKNQQPIPIADFLTSPTDHAEIPAACHNLSFSIEAAASQRRGNELTSLINIGAAANLLSGEARHLLNKHSRSLGFTYVRMQEVVSNSFIPMTTPDYNYYFKNVDIVFTFLYENQLVPFIELSRLAFDFSLSVNHQYSFCSVSRNSRFFLLFESFIFYCITKWPAEWLSQWKFEFWFAPTDTIDTYCKNYQTIQKILNKYNPSIQFGGPGYNKCSTNLSLEKIITGLQRNSIQPDFFSIYLHLFTRNQTSSDDYINKFHISTDKNYLVKTCRQIKNLVNQAFPSVPLYATEWNSAFIPDLPISYSCFQAAFIVKSIRDLYAELDLLGYWLFSDTSMSETTRRPSTYYYNGQGMFNREHIATPAFYCFEFMNLLGHTIISIGDNYLATKQSDKHCQIIAFNYAPISADKLMTHEQYPFNNLYEIFESGVSIHVNLSIDKLRKGLYKVTRYLLDRFHGSILDLLIGEYTHSNISQIDFLENVKAPYLQKQNYRLKACIPEERVIYTYAEESLIIASDLPVHSVCVWDILLQV